MSSSIQIPRRRRKLTDLQHDQAPNGSSTGSAFSPETPSSSYDSVEGSERVKREGEVGVSVAAAVANRPARGLSLLSMFTVICVAKMVLIELCLLLIVARYVAGEG